MKRISIPQIIEFLKGKPAITALLGDRIYWNIPVLDQTGIYLCLSEVTEVQDTVDADSRVEFRIIANDEKVKWSDMVAVEHAITDEIASKGAINFGSFKATNVVLNSNIFQGFDEKTRKIYIRDYSFHYLS